MKRPRHTFLEIDNVSHTFSESLTAIENVTMSLETGSFVAMVGTSGVGKSTVLRIVGGLLDPTQGEVRLNNGSTQSTNVRIGIVFQRDNLMPWRTVRENIRLPLELQGIGKESAIERVDQMIDLVGLVGFDDSFPTQLSGGMAQRVAIARALVHRPALLLLDEPFGALDALTRERMSVELLHVWNALPVTVLLVTHSIVEAILLADEVVVMSGRPGTITARIPVNLPRPRQLEVQTSDEFHRLSALVRNAIGADKPLVQ